MQTKFSSVKKILSIIEMIVRKIWMPSNNTQVVSMHKPAYDQLFFIPFFQVANSGTWAPSIIWLYDF